MFALSKTELDTMSDFQRELHLHDDEGEGSEDMSSVYYHEHRKLTWHVRATVKSKCVSGEEGQIVFDYDNNNYSYLNYSYMRSVLPEVKVKEEYADRIKIAYCHNPGTAHIIDAEFQVDDIIPGRFDNIWLDFYYQRLLSPGYRDSHNEDVGNVPFLEEWSSRLPEYVTNVSHPWFYAQSLDKAFPIFFGTSQTRIKHVYRVKQDVSEILRMAESNDGGETWTQIPVNMSYLISPPKLKVPELWYDFSLISKDEIEFRKQSNKINYYINDVAKYDCDDPIKYNSTATIDIHSDYPVKAILWGAENTSASQNNNYSNYTTCTDDLYEGSNPIKITSLSCFGNKKFEKMPSDHFGNVQARHHNLAPPSERGINLMMICHDVRSSDSDIGLIFPVKANTKMIMEISDTHPFVRSSSDTYFLPRVRMLVQRKITIRKVKAGTKVGENGEPEDIIAFIFELY